MTNAILFSVLRNKCPRCHNTNVFLHPTTKLNAFTKMNKSCTCCGEVYEKEPGYFYGAMYVSYALMVGWFVITWAADSFFIHSETWVYLSFVSLTMFLLMPITFRTSRLLWLNFFIRYDKDSCLKYQQKNKIK